MRATTLHLLRQALNNPTADFHPHQWEAIEAIVSRRLRLLLVQRTGWGKSMVYFLATRLLREQKAGPTLLISPLLALMRNQLDMALRINVKAATINSTNQQDWQIIWQQLHRDEIDLLLISPERLANDKFRTQFLLQVIDRIGLFVVDEAHCISDWGHDFRPDYRRINRIIQTLPHHIPVLATTATANNRVMADIQMQLGGNIKVLRGPLARQSLWLQNIILPNPIARMAWLAEHLPKLPGTGIIYTLTVRDAEQLAQWLRSRGLEVYPYHSALPSVNREALERSLLHNQLKALVATSALGMGFDKPDLSFVIHYQCPASAIHYYQQVGRAGRALTQAYGILFSGREDDDINNYFIQTAFPTPIHVAQVLNALNRAERGLTVAMLEQQVNLHPSQIEKALKILMTETPSPVSKDDYYWYANPVNYQIDSNKIIALTNIRYQERERMREYLYTRECLMLFLKRELDDADTTPCGRCASCQQRALLPITSSPVSMQQATKFLEQQGITTIQPRKQWPTNQGLVEYRWLGKNIPRQLQAEPGMVLSIWGKPEWGELVQRGKQQDGHFDHQLVMATAALINNHWRPYPLPRWVTCVPSLKHPHLVADFAQRLAAMLHLPFVPLIRKTRATLPQKEMQNSYQQVRNLVNAFMVERWEGMQQPVLLIDDIVDSRWTLTILAALLRQAGSGQVFPLALATSTVKDS